MFCCSSPQRAQKLYQGTHRNQAVIDCEPAGVHVCRSKKYRRELTQTRRLSIEVFQFHNTLYQGLMLQRASAFINQKPFSVALWLFCALYQVVCKSGYLYNKSPIAVPLYVLPVASLFVPSCKSDHASSIATISNKPVHKTGPVH